MEYILGVVDTIKSWSRSLFLFFSFLMLLNIGWALSVLKFATYLFFAFCCYDAILLIVSTVQLFIDSEDSGVIGIISTVIEWLTFIVAIIFIVIYSIATANSELVIFQGDNSNLVNTFFVTCIIMILRNWIQEILMLPISLIGVFLDGDYD